MEKVSLFIPPIKPSPETQVFFNEAIPKTFILTYESWTSDRKPVDTVQEFQIDISSASNSISPLYLIAAHQKRQRPNPADHTINLPNDRINNPIFDHVRVGKNYAEVDGVRYPKKPITINYDKNNYLDQYRDLKLIYKELVGETMFNPIIPYDKMKSWYPFELNDLRFQADHISPNKIRFFTEYSDNPVNTIINIILINHRKNNTISEGKKNYHC